MPSSLSYPWTKSPLIASAPMGGFALHNLACTVSQAGGLGFIGSVSDMHTLSEELHFARQKLAASNINTTSESQLPIGIGFLLFIADLEAAAILVEQYKPVALWLFAAKSNTDYMTWTERMREVSEKTEIWIQTGSVTSALEIAQSSRPDVLVLQGHDAGGHGYEKGASIISLIPETVTALQEAGMRNQIKVIASGGIADGRGVAAALALGAEGVVMGTRFLASEEVVLPAPAYGVAILEAHDGGQNTVRDKVFDHLKGPNPWPVEYDGRSIIVDTYLDHRGGISIDEIRRLYKQAEGSAEKGFGSIKGQGRAAIWAGTGVGLVKREQSARDIVEEVREQAQRVLSSFQSKL